MRKVTSCRGLRLLLIVPIGVRALFGAHRWMRVVPLAVALALLQTSIILPVPLASPVAAATTITVNSTEDTTVSGDGKCTLREAIANVNISGQTTGADCAAATGNDTIVFNFNPPTNPATITLDTTKGTLEVRRERDDQRPGSDGDDRGWRVHDLRWHHDAQRRCQVFTIIGPTTSVTIAGMTVQHGFAGSDPNLSTSLQAGGIFIDQGGLTVRDCIVRNNVGGLGGGIGTRPNALANTTGVIVERSTLTGNRSLFGEGGGLFYSQTGTLRITNSTIVGNHSTDSVGPFANGGGVAADLSFGASAIIINTTIARNTAENLGGGLYSQTTSTTLINTLVAGNVVANNNGGTTGGPDVQNDAGIGTSNIPNNNLIGNGDNSALGGTGLADGTNGNHVGTTAQPINPLLATTLAANGSTNGTQTLALLPGSLAINAGDNTTCNTTTGTAPVNKKDQRGITRPQPVSGQCDIGAFESQGFSLLLSGGDTQSTNVNTAFLNPLAVTVSSSHSEPVDGGQVTFTAVPGGSGQSATLATSPATIASGTASVTATANSAVGSYTVTAVANSVTGTATFHLTNTPGPASTLTPNPNTPQSAPVTTAFPTLSVTVKDASGNLVADGTQVTFTVTPAGNGASVNFSNSGNATTTSGVASITATANTIAGGPYTVTATSNSHTATFSLTNTPGAPAMIVATAGTPQHATVGTSFTTALAALVTDANSNPVGAGVSVTFTIVPATGAGGSFPGNATTATVSTNSSGVASAPTLTANTVSGTFTVTANLTTGPLGTPATFTLTNDPGPATLLIVAGYPASVVSGTAHTFTVTARDQYGNTATGYTGTVRFTSTDSHATLPVNFPFTAGDAGVHQFTATFGAAGTWNLTATDTATASITGTQTGINVTVAPLISIAVTPNSVTLKVGQMQPFTATGTYADNSTADLTSAVTWTSDAPSVGTVDASGKAMGVTPGTAHITATQGNITSGQATVTVSAPVLTGVQPAPAPQSRPSEASTNGMTTPAPAPVPSGSPSSGGVAPVAAPAGR